MKTFTTPSAHRIWLMSFISTMLLFTSIKCLADDNQDSQFRNMEISLLTCSPHDEIYSLYGHTAIRCCDSITGQDIVINYGVFSFDQPYFIPRFIFGLTDYCMGAYTMNQFLAEYSYYNCSVTQQVLNLTESEKKAIMQALATNALPENVTYRYNFFHDNCTTRARDMITDHLGGKIDYNNEIDENITFRDMVHACTSNYPWNQFGIDLLLGMNADKPTTRSQQQFLPSNLMRDFSKATILSDNKERPLVKHTFDVLQGGIQVEGEGFPISPTACFIILLTITLIIIAVEQKTLKMQWGYDLVMLLVCGLSGLVLTLMIFSHHPTVSLNLQILLLNPLHLFFVFPLCRNSHKGKDHWWWKAWFILCILFVLGVFFQKYAEGMLILALSLLLRIISHNILLRRKSKRLQKSR